MIKKADILLAILLIFIGLGTSFSLAKSQDPGIYAEITVAGELYGTYDLREDREITIRQNGHTNVLLIEDGSIRMVSSDCHNHQCIRQGSINTVSQTIVCLPNQVFVNISGENRTFDAVAY